MHIDTRVHTHTHTQRHTRTLTDIHAHPWYVKTKILSCVQERKAVPPNVQIWPLQQGVPFEQTTFAGCIGRSME